MTETAAKQLQGLLAQKDLLDQGLRVFAQAGGCAGLEYGMSCESVAWEGDVVIEKEGIGLFIDPFSSRFLKGACID